MAASKEDSEFSKIIRGTIEAAPTSPKFASSHSDYQDQDQDGTPDLEILLDSGPIGSVIPKSSSNTGGFSFPLLANDALAANLATVFPRTPQKTTPNSGRKRRYIPNLSRPLASPSHGTRMSMMFQNAASVLQNTTSPSRQASPNTKKSRLPISQTCCIKFGEANYENRHKISNPGNIHSGFDKSAAFDIQSAPHESWPHPSIPGGRQSPINAPISAADQITYKPIVDHLSPPQGSERLTLPKPRRYLGSPFKNDCLGQEPISSGFATPAAPTRQIESVLEISSPDLEHRRKPSPESSVSSVDSDRDDQSSGHSFRVITPFSHLDAEEAQRANIDAWLNQVMGVPNDSVQRSNEPCAKKAVDDLAKASATSSTAGQRIEKPTAMSPARPLQDLESSSKASSNKENVPPKSSSHSPIRPPIQEIHGFTPSRFRVPSFKATNQYSTSPTRFTHPLTPQGHLALPPKRKKPRVDSNKRTDPKPSSPSKDFTIHDDELADALAKLSPSVERHRKGKGPKRERCVSYWDGDILMPGCGGQEAEGGGREEEEGGSKVEGKMLRNGKVILGEMEMSGGMRGETGFAEEARGQGKAVFNFRA